MDCLTDKKHEIKCPMNKTCFHSITNDPEFSADGGGNFALASSTGAVTVNVGASLDRETTPSYALLVRVADGGGLVTTATVSVFITGDTDGGF